MARKQSQAEILTPFSVKVIRTGLNLSQKELGELCGVSSPFIYYIENGERNLTATMEKKLLKAFGLTNDQINSIVLMANGIRAVFNDKDDTKPNKPTNE